MAPVDSLEKFAAEMRQDFDPADLDALAEAGLLGSRTDGGASAATSSARSPIRPSPSWSAPNAMRAPLR
jgi:hypothetical protein